MKKYNWTIDTLISKMNLIEKLIETETDEKKLELLRFDYTTLKNHIDEFFDNSIYETLKLLESLEYIKGEYTQIDFLWDDFAEFAEITYDYINIPKLKRCSLSKTDLLDITHDFYKSLNKVFYGNFMKNFYRRNDHIVFKAAQKDNKFIGETIILPSLRESFIDIYRNYTADDILTTIHEYSHATSTSINPYHLVRSTKTLYTEIDTLFMEFIAADFVDKQMHTSNAPIHKASKLNEFSANAYDICSQIDLIEAEKFTKNGYLNNKQLKQIALEKCELQPNEVEDLLNEPNVYSTVYLTSYMFALELYKLYLEDKEKALYYLQKIILLDHLNEEEYYCNIKRFGLIPNLSVQEFYKECKNDALKLTRKKPKD